MTAGGNAPSRLSKIDRGVIFDATTAPADARSCAFTLLLRRPSAKLLIGFRNATARDSPDGSVFVAHYAGDAATSMY